MWSVVTQTALVIIPEEAELLIPLVRNNNAEASHTHLLTYAAPVTRKMLRFNNLGYYAVPDLPAGWKPPQWLTIELGILAGRLYFEFEEYGDICRYLGIQPSGTAGDVNVTTGEEDTDTAETETQQSQCFTTKPLTFLQEWLAVRRKGQDFTHTPMGYICQRKQLTASNPFFSTFEGSSNTQLKSIASHTRNGGGAERAANGDVVSDVEFDEEDFYLDEEEDGGDKYSEDELASE